jgi:hypothetical protein
MMAAFYNRAGLLPHEGGNANTGCVRAPSTPKVAKFLEKTPRSELAAASVMPNSI